MTTSGVTVLDARARNRAVLARQLLTKRAKLSVEAALEHLVGMQSQVPLPAYFGLWSRLHAFEPDDLGAMLTARTAARIALMRGTIHVVTARDALALRPLMQPVLTRALFTGPHASLKGLEPDALETAARALFRKGPLDATDLGAAMAETFPGRPEASLVFAARALLPLVQTPPRGVWGKGGKLVYALADTWLDAPNGKMPPVAIGDVILRYLAAFGPATINDIQVWSGLTRLRSHVDALRQRLVTFRSPTGDELFDLPEAPRPGARASAPVRFLPDFDNLLLSYDGAIPVLADIAHRAAIFTVNGIIRATVLVDGFVAATWKVTRAKKTATLSVSPFARLAAADAKAIREEGERLLVFAEPKAETRVVAIEKPA